MSRLSLGALRCCRCRIHPQHCICDVLRARWLETRVALVVHRFEIVKTSGTGHLARACLPNSEVFIHGMREQQLDLRYLHESHRVLLLFPAPGAPVLSRELISRDPRPLLLAVPDGNWNQARRMPKRIPGLESKHAVQLPVGARSQWGVRRATSSGGLATLEAIARALGIIEGEAIERELHEVVLAHAQATWAMRGNAHSPPQRYPP